ncbi:hypothetical protein P376_1666 [Streptomyces sp. HCCB10043]|nr:hypothetical protein P376_1666 [Streptomyces sp. HCCB10043]
MAAQVEEVVLGPDGRQAEDLREQAAQDLLLRGARPAAGACGGGEVGCGQGLAVELAVGGQGQYVQSDDRGRHHVGGQLSGEVGTERGGVRGVMAGRGHRVGDEALLARLVLMHDDRRPGDRRVLVQRPFDLAEFDPKAADLDLVVDAVEEFQVAVGVPADEVASAVHAPAGGAEGVRDETLGGECGPVEVAPGHARAGEVELSRHPRRHRPQGAVEHVRPGVGERQADGRAVGVLLVQERGGGPDGRLGGPVHIGDLTGGVTQGARQRPGQRLTSHEDLHLPEALGVSRGQQGLPQRGRRLHHGRAGGGDEPAQGVRVLARLLGGEHDPAAADEGKQQFEVGNVEAERRHREQTVLGAEGKPAPEVRQQIDQVLAGDDGALGSSGGSGCVDDVSGVTGMGMIAWLERHTSNPRRDAMRCSARPMTR